MVICTIATVPGIGRTSLLAGGPAGSFGGGGVLYSPQVSHSPSGRWGPPAFPPQPQDPFPVITMSLHEIIRIDDRRGEEEVRSQPVALFSAASGIPSSLAGPPLKASNDVLRTLKLPCAFMMDRFRGTCSQHGWGCFFFPPSTEGFLTHPRWVGGFRKGLPGSPFLEPSGQLLAGTVAGAVFGAGAQGLGACISLSPLL